LSPKTLIYAHEPLENQGFRPVNGYVAEELLEGADGTAGSQGDGLDGLALEVGEESAAVGVQVGEGLGVAATEQVGPQEVLQGGSQGIKLFLRHGAGLLAVLLLF
jgi:hypothetical protein